MNWKKLTKDLLAGVVLLLISPVIIITLIYRTATGKRWSDGKTPEEVAEEDLREAAVAVFKEMRPDCTEEQIRAVLRKKQ